MSELVAHAHEEHRDDFGDKLGMWLFLVTEIMLFGGLFIAYSYLRYRYPMEFHHGGQQLDTTLGVLNTVILLTSSLTVVLSLVAIQKGDLFKTKLLLWATVVLGAFFLVNKAIEWSGKFHHGLYPGAGHMAKLPQGEKVFFSLYYSMTGLHGLHVLIGISILAWVAFLVARGRITPDRFVILENAGLYWHLVDVIWIYLLPLFYLAA